MSEFVRASWFFSSELFKFMTLFYVVWVPGFLLAGLLTCRFRSQALSSVLGNPGFSLIGVSRAVGLGIVGSAGRKASMNTALYLLNRDVSPSLAFAFLIASRNMTILFWSIFALSLGAEFATGQLLGALVMIGIIVPSLYWINLKFTAKSNLKRHTVDLSTEMPRFPTCSALLMSFAGWRSVLGFIRREIVRFAPSLLIGILVAGIIFAAGLRPWWPQFANVFGYATLLSDLGNSVVAPFLSAIVFLSPVGNIPLIHALFKTDGLSYAGVISFCLASSIHPKDVKAYAKAFGPKKTLALVGTLYVAAVLGGLGSTWIYAAIGFRPSLPPVKLVSKLMRALFEYLSF